MSTTEILPEDSAHWLEDTLVYDSWNEFRDGDPHRQETFQRCEPTGEFCYWCAIGGQCFSLKSPTNDSCIAAVESALKATKMRRNESNYYDSVYVIWQPKNHSTADWIRWSNKWSKRTALTPP